MLGAPARFTDFRYLQLCSGTTGDTAVCTKVLGMKSYICRSLEVVSPPTSASGIPRAQASMRPVQNTCLGLERPLQAQEVANAAQQSSLGSSTRRWHLASCIGPAKLGRQEVGRRVVTSSSDVTCCMRAMQGNQKRGQESQEQRRCYGTLAISARW